MQYRYFRANKNGLQLNSMVLTAEKQKQFLIQFTQKIRLYFKDAIQHEPITLVYSI